MGEFFESYAIWAIWIIFGLTFLIFMVMAPCHAVFVLPFAGLPLFWLLPQSNIFLCPGKGQTSNSPDSANIRLAYEATALFSSCAIKVTFAYIVQPG